MFMICLQAKFYIPSSSDSPSNGKQQKVCIFI